MIVRVMMICFFCQCYCVSIMVSTMNNRNILGWKNNRNPASLKNIHESNIRLAEVIEEYIIEAKVTVFSFFNPSSNSVKIIQLLMNNELDFYLVSPPVKSNVIPDIDILSELIFIILMNNADDSSEMLQMRIHKFHRRFSYVFVFDYVKHLNPYSLASKLWNRSIVDVVIIVQTANGSEQTYDNSNFSNMMYCRTPTLDFSFGYNYYTSNYSQENIQDSEIESTKCSLRVGFLGHSTYSIIGDKIESCISVIENKLLELISDRFDIEIEVNHLNWTLSPVTLNRVHRKLPIHSHYDIITGGHPWVAFNSYDSISSTRAYEISSIIWLLPTSNPVSILGLITPFQYEVWLVLVILLILGSAVFIILGTKYPILNILSLLVGNVVPKLPKRQLNRIYFSVWLLFGYTTSQYYLASLSGELFEDSVSILANYDDLMSSDLILEEQGNLNQLLKYGNKIFERKFKRTDKNESIDSQLSQKPEEKKLSLMSYDIYRKRLLELKDGVNKSSALLALLSNQQEKYCHNQHMYCLGESAGIYPQGLIWNYDDPKYFPWINDIIPRILQNGLKDMWLTLINRPKEDEYIYVFLGLKQLVPGFLLLVIGLAIASIVNCVEIIVKRCKRRKI